MAETTADFMLKRLSEWGVSRIYGYPGDGINGLLSALDRAMDQFEFVQVRHEEEAAFMACAHAKFTGELGVCLATSGPGAIHLLNGLYDAKLDHQPVLAIVGQAVRMSLGGDFQQEVDLHSLFKGVASDYLQTCTTAPQMRHLVDRAIRTSLARRTVTCLIVPNDVQELEAEQPPRAHGSIHSGVGYEAPRVVLRAPIWPADIIALRPFSSCRKPWVVAAHVQRITVAQDRIAIEVDRKALAARLLDQDALPASEARKRGAITIEVPVRFRRRGVEAKLVVLDHQHPASGPDPNLIKALARAHEWFGQIVRGEADGVGAIARAERLDRAYVTRMLCLAFLAPDIARTVMDGRQAPELTAKRLIRSALNFPLLWPDQVDMFRC